MKLRDRNEIRLPYDDECGRTWWVAPDAALTEVFATVLPHLNERQRRVLVGAGARAMGQGRNRSGHSCVGVVAADGDEGCAGAR